MSLIRRAGAEVLRLLKLAVDPAAAADEVQVYQKKVSGVTQLSARVDNGAIYQLTPVIVSDTIVANQNDYAPTNYEVATVFEISPSGASRTITGLQGGQSGRIVYIHNPASSGQLLTISGNDSSSAAANRFQTADANTGNASTILRPSAGAAFIYISSRWMEIAKTSGYNIIADFNLTSNGTLTVAGAATVGTIIATTANLSVLTLFGTSTTIAADQDDWTPNSFNISSRVELDPTGVNRTITGMTGGQASRIVLLWNTSTTLTVTLSHQNAASLAANRFLCPGAVDYAILPGRAVWVVYTGSRWVLMVS